MILNMKVIVKKNRNLSLDEYLNKITPYLKMYYSADVLQTS